MPLTAVKKCVALATAWLLLSQIAAAQTSKLSPEATFFPENLGGAAHQTYANFINAYNRGEEKAWPEGAEAEISAKYWANPIRALKPLKVYLHRINVVVVQRVENGIEEGKYILIPVSSYLPRNGDDGFQFTPNPQRNRLYYAGDGVLEFKRTRGK